MKIGIQMYSLREYTQNSLDEALDAVKESGFDGVELAGFCGLTAKELKAKLDARGLIVSGAHTGIDAVLNDFDKTAKDAETLGFKDLIISAVDSKSLYENADGVIDKLNQAAEICKKAGFRLGYHNHDFEFNGSVNYLNIFADKVKSMFFEPDLFWFKTGGQDFFEFVKKAGDRIKVLHVKELSKEGEEAANPLPGDGAANIREILNFAKKQKNIEWAVLEAEKLGCNYKDYIKASKQRIAEMIK